MRFELRAITPAGRIATLRWHAGDALAARRRAEGRGYSVLSVRARSPLWGALDGAVPARLFAQELAALLRAGLPLLEAIRTLAAQERAAAARAPLELVAAGLSEGQSLSETLEAAGRFPALLVAALRAAERSGAVEAALERYAGYAGQMEALRRRIWAASLYPVLLTAAAALVMLFLLSYVVPRFGAIYEERGDGLPASSALLLAWAGFLQAHGTFALMALGAALAATGAGLHRAFARGTLLRLPGVGGALHAFQLARFYRSAALLLQGGIPLLQALGLAGGLLLPGFRARLEHARHAIEQGGRVSECLDAHGLATPAARRMLVVGERSGDMAGMMERIAAYHEETLGRRIDAFARLFEPLLMAFIGLMIGGIVVLMYLPIFDLAGSLP